MNICMDVLDGEYFVRVCCCEKWDIAKCEIKGDSNRSVSKIFPSEDDFSYHRGIVRVRTYNDRRRWWRQVYNTEQAKSSAGGSRVLRRVELTTVLRLLRASCLGEICSPTKTVRTVIIVFYFTGRFKILKFKNLTEKDTVFFIYLFETV